MPAFEADSVDNPPWKRINNLPSPTIWVSDEWINYQPLHTKLGDTFSIAFEGEEFIYEIKAYEYGWWKIEWPD